MTRQVSIKINVGGALLWLGTIYRNPADAIKEHISNAIDEHLKAQHDGRAEEHCEVVFTLDKQSVTIEYPYGMDQREFETALHRVADSAKKASDVGQIGRLGIGIFSFQQIGRKCTFLSRKNANADTIRVTLREGSDQAEFDSALKREALKEPGIRIQITELKIDPTRARGPLSPERLQRAFAEKFDGYLRMGWLRIQIRCGSRTYDVAPLPIDLPRVAEGLEKISLPAEPEKTVGLNLYFDPSGKGVVAIRHMGVAVVEAIKALPAYGLVPLPAPRGHTRAG